MAVKRGLDENRRSRAPRPKVPVSQETPRNSANGNKRTRSARSLFPWGEKGNVADEGLDSGSDDEDGDESSRVRKKTSDEDAGATEVEARETAEEKRVRLARDVIFKLDVDQRGSARDETHDGDGSGDFIGKRLAEARLEATGQLHREVACKLQGLRVQAGSYRRMRGHKLSPTCVVLAPNDRSAFSGSKDNSIIRWDVETGKRDILVPQWKKSRGGQIPDVKSHSNEVLALAVSGDGRYLASGGRDRLIHVWDCRTNGHVETFRGHQDAVSALSFRTNSLALFSGSHDRCVKHWDLNEMGYVETMFGHQSDINAIDSWCKERAVTGGRDRTARLWKVLEDSHLVFRPVGGGSVDCIRMLNEDWFLTGGEDGSLSLWFGMKKKPVTTVPAAHGSDSAGTPRWISALGSLRQSDLVVSGSSDGSARLWRADIESRSLTQVASVSLEGFVNGIAVSSTGKFMVAAVGQEHRLGRWERRKAARNSLCVVPLLEEGANARTD